MPPYAAIDPPSRRRTIEAILVLALLTAMLHGFALFDGSVLDDHWHQRGLSEHGWGFSELLRTLNIAPSDFADCWWQNKYFRWDYLRPFFILCMKFMYVTVGGGDPTALHAFSVGLHFAAAIMLWRLCLRLTSNYFWSLVAGMAFVTYQHSATTVAWPSSQNVVLQTTLLLATLLCYIRASGLNIGLDCANAHSGNVFSPKWFVLALLFWILALFSRENALLMPAILGSFDLAFGGWKTVWRRWWVYGVLIAIGTAFFAWRESLDVHPLPAVYMRHADGGMLEYAGWLAAKLLHYLYTSLLPAPMSVGPTGRYNPWLSTPGDCVFMIALLAYTGILYWGATRAMRGWWIWPLWILMSVMPVVAVIATPHNGYMSGVGMALWCGLAGVCACRRNAATKSVNPRGAREWWSIMFMRAVVAGAIFLVLGSTFMGAVNRLQFFATSAADKYVPGWIMLSPPPPEATDVFIINQPFVNIYCKQILVKQLGERMKSVGLHPLTFAPQIHQMDRRSVLEQVDAHSFTVEVEGQGYFSRALGRFLLGAFRTPPRQFRTGDVIDGGKVKVEILRADGGGVWKLKFTFPHPLNDPRYCFYFSSMECGAARLRFRPSAEMSEPQTPAAPIDNWADMFRASRMLEGGHANAAESLFATVIDRQSTFTSDAEAALKPALQCMTTALGSSLQGIAVLPDPSPSDWISLRSWWRQHVDDTVLKEILPRRQDFEYLLWLRSEIEWDRDWARLVLRSDIYLSGPPFDDPRE